MASMVSAPRPSWPRPPPDPQPCPGPVTRLHLLKQLLPSFGMMMVSARLCPLVSLSPVPSPEPPDPPDTSAVNTSSSLSLVMTRTSDLEFSIPTPESRGACDVSNLDLKIQTFRKLDLSSQIFKETFLPKDFGLMILIVVFIRLLTEAHTSLTFTMSCSYDPLLEDLILLLDTSLQVIDLKLYVSILLASILSFECSLVPCYDTLASVRLSAVCSLCSSLTPANDSLKLLPHRLWQIRKEILVLSIFSVFLDCLSFVKYDCLPYVPFGLSGCVAGSIVLNIMYASMFVQLKGLSIWCFVTSACDAEFLIVKAASVAVSITGVRPVRMLSNPQSLISLLSMIGVEFRGLLCDIRCYFCVIVAPILWCCISLLCFAMVAADVLAGLALFLLDVNNFSSYGD